MATPRIHRLLVDAVANLLTSTFTEKKPADKVLEKYFKDHRKLGARDRRFIAEEFYDSVRWWRKLWYLLGIEPDLTRENILRIWGVLHLLKGGELPDWYQYQIPNLQQLRESENTISDLAIAESIPMWLNELGKCELAERWPAILHSLNDKAPVDLRCNTLKTNLNDLKTALESEDVKVTAIEACQNGLSLVERKNLVTTKAFQSGLFEVQDRASQRIAPFLQVAPGMRVIDACAGAGGKSLHISAEMHNQGQVIAMDINQRKLNELRQRAQRAGVTIIETRLIESAQSIESLAGTADRVLLDVPCSGSGVLRRNPDSKWKLSREEIERLVKVQQEILGSYSKMVKVGGTLVYATCSFLPSENENQISWFTNTFQGWKVQEQLRIDPDQGLGDGFFAARLRRED